MGRTQKEWEDYCIKYIKDHDNHFGVFWATDNKFIANAMDRLKRSKRIVITPLQFPTSKVRFYKKEFNGKNKSE